jgi:hypothetical protein
MYVTPLRRVFRGSTLVASYGENTFALCFTEDMRRQFPDYVTNVTFIGRLVSNHTIVNVDIGMEYDDSIGGYVASFDLRDPGAYTLQVSCGCDCDCDCDCDCTAYHDREPVLFRTRSRWRGTLGRVILGRRRSRFL